MLEKLKFRICVYFASKLSGYEICYLSLERSALNGNISWEDFEKHMGNLKAVIGVEAFNKMMEKFIAIKK